MDKKITPVAANKMTVEEAKANYNSFRVGNPKRGLAYDTLLNAIERAGQQAGQPDFRSPVK